jgi:hypothetical protein
MHTLFHAIDPDDVILCHNLNLSNGLLTSASLLRAASPSLHGLRSPYEALTGEAEKEQFFEQVRASSFSHLPSRLGALFLFASSLDAQSANERWWAGKRRIFSAKIVIAQRLGAFDSVHLDQPRSSWNEGALLYWSGAQSVAPRAEIVLEGSVQLQGWEALATPWPVSRRN